MIAPQQKHVVCYSSSIKKIVYHVCFLMHQETYDSYQAQGGMDMTTFRTSSMLLTLLAFNADISVLSYFLLSHHRCRCLLLTLSLRNIRRYIYMCIYTNNLCTAESHFEDFMEELQGRAVYDTCSLFVQNEYIYIYLKIWTDRSTNN